MEHMTSNECADYLRVHVNTLRKYVNEEGLPVLRFPGRRAWTFRKDLVDAWVYERSQPEIVTSKNGVKYAEKPYNGKLKVMIP